VDECKPLFVGNPDNAVHVSSDAMSCPLPAARLQGLDEDGNDTDAVAVTQPKTKNSHLSIYCSTVGQKPSKADFYLDDPDDVIQLLSTLATSGANAAHV